MAGFDDALERLVTDPRFRAQMEQDPQAALADYDLTDDERQLLTSQLSHEAGASGGVEQRTSKSGLAGVMGMLDVGTDTPQESDLEFVSRLMEDETTVDTSPSMTTDAEADDGPTTQDLTASKYVDTSGDVDQPVIVGSVYNAEDAGGDGDYGYMDDDIPSGAPPPSDGIQDGLSNTVLVSETTDEPDLAGNEPPGEGNKPFVGGLSFGTDDAAPGGGQNEVRFEDAPGTEEADSHGMSSPYIKMAAFDNKADPSGDPDDLVADGNDERPGSPTIAQSLTNNEVIEHDDSHEIEMDVHVGRSEPDDVMTDQDPDAGSKESPVKAGYDLKVNKKV